MEMTNKVLSPYNMALNDMATSRSLYNVVNRSYICFASSVLLKLGYSSLVTLIKGYFRKNDSNKLFSIHLLIK